MRSKAVLLVFCFWPILNFINQNKEQLGQGDYVVLGSFFALTLVVPVTLSVLGRWRLDQWPAPAYSVVTDGLRAPHHIDACSHKGSPGPSVNSFSSLAWDQRSRCRLRRRSITVITHFSGSHP